MWCGEWFYVLIRKMALVLFALSTVTLVIPLFGNLDVAKSQSNAYGLHDWGASGCTGGCNKTKIESSFILACCALFSLVVVVVAFLYHDSKPDECDPFVLKCSREGILSGLILLLQFVLWLIFVVHVILDFTKNTEGGLAIAAVSFAGTIFVCLFLKMLWHACKDKAIEYKDVLTSFISVTLGLTAYMWWCIHDGFGNPEFGSGANLLYTSSICLMCAVPLAYIDIVKKSDPSNKVTPVAARAEMEQLVVDDGATGSRSVDNWKF